MLPDISITKTSIIGTFLLFSVLLLAPQRALSVHTESVKTEMNETPKKSFFKKTWIKIQSNEKLLDRYTALAKKYGIISAISLVLGVILTAINIPILVLLGIVLLIVATISFAMTIYYGNLSFYKDADKDTRYRFVRIAVLAIAVFLAIISNVLYFTFRRR